MRNAMRRHCDRFAPFHHDRAGALLDEADDTAQGRAAPRPVAAKERDEFALVHRHVDAMKRMRLAIKGMQIGDAQLLDRVVMMCGAH